jgi:serine/threonine-protein kinase
MIDKTISHYKILEKLGEGGMGVVYKAEDMNLRRTVALKFLSPQAFIGDEEKARFVHEAQTAASLNHSSICHVYEIDESDGQTFIAMEYVDGKSLKAKIESGPLKLHESVDIAIKMAEGLLEAHAKGIIHRDIKPANVMITHEGQPKITDFGLAKSAKRTMLTKTGTTLGTVAYMSPEQTRGEGVDHRTDIWSLGAVIYEMVTGQRAFKGDYEQAVVYSILNQQPEPMTALRTGVPMEMERIVTKAMAKDPADRYQHVDEMPVDLRALKAGLVGISTASAAGAATAPTGPPALRRRGTVLALGGLIVGAVISALAVWGLMRERPVKLQSVTRFAVTLPWDQELARNAPPIAISPDGKFLAYVAHSGGGYPQLYLRPLDRLEAVVVPGTERAADPFFSPDGRWVGFFAEGKLKKVAVAGGVPMTISDALYAGTGASWGPDDTVVFPVTESSGLVRVPASGGAPEALTAPDLELGEVCHRRPHVLPEGNGVLFTKLTAEGSSLTVLNLKTGELRTLLSDVAEAIYLRTGHLICAGAGALRAVPFDPLRLEITGSTTPVLDRIHSSTFYGLKLTYFAISQTGTIVYVPSFEANTENALVWVDRSGKAAPLSEDWASVRYPRFSPDGAHIAVTEVMSGARADIDIWIYGIERGTRTRLTAEGNNILPVWTPDGQRVTFGSNRSGPISLFWKAADGSGEAQLLLDREYSQFPESWSPDGRTLAFTEFNPRTPRAWWKVDDLDRGWKGTYLVA